MLCVKATTRVRKKAKMAELGAVMAITAANILIAMNIGRTIKNRHASPRRVGMTVTETPVNGTKHKLRDAKFMVTAYQLPTKNRPWNLVATAKREMQVDRQPMRATFALGKWRTRLLKVGKSIWVLPAQSTKTAGFLNKKEVVAVGLGESN